jgi:hypothetical protein
MTEPITVHRGMFGFRGDTGGAILFWFAAIVGPATGRTTFALGVAEGTSTGPGSERAITIEAPSTTISTLSSKFLIK